MFNLQQRTTVSGSACLPNSLLTLCIFCMIQTVYNTLGELRRHHSHTRRLIAISLRAISQHRTGGKRVTLASWREK